MQINEARKCIDYLYTMGVKRVVLIGGEPTIYKDIVTLLSYIKSKNMRSSIATNGRRFSDIEFTRQIIQTGVCGINVSIKDSVMFSEKFGL